MSLASDKTHKQTSLALMVLELSLNLSAMIYHMKGGALPRWDHVRLGPLRLVTVRGPSPAYHSLLGNYCLSSESLCLDAPLVHSQKSPDPQHFLNLNVV